MSGSILLGAGAARTETIEIARSRHVILGTNELLAPATRSLLN